MKTTLQTATVPAASSSWLLAAGIVLTALAWSILAFAERSLTGYFACILVAWLGFWLVWRQTVGLSPRQLVYLLWGGATAWRLVGWWAPPVFENDWARFLWDGWLTRTGHDPYLSVPLDWFTVPSVPAPLMGVLDQVNHPALRTVYGPVAQWWFAFSAWVAPGSLSVFKAVLLTVDLGVVALLHRTVGPRRAMLYAWCPLVIQETAFSAHPDVLALGFMLVAWQIRRWRGLSGGVLALALATRPHALLLAPFLLWRTGWRGGLGLGLGLLVCYFPGLWQGHGSDLSTLAQMGGDWRFNDILRSALSQLFEAPDVARLTLLVLCFGGLCAFWIWKKQPGDVAPPLDFLYGWWWLCSPVANAWYLQFAVPFLVFRYPSSAFTWSLLVTAPLTYAVGLQMDSSQEAWELASWVMPVEALAVLFTVTFCSLRRLSLSSAVS